MLDCVFYTLLNINMCFLVIALGCICMPFAVLGFTKNMLLKIVWPKKPLIPSVVAIFGANQALAEALAYEYARSKTSLILVGYREEYAAYHFGINRLDRIAQKCQELGCPSIMTQVLDITSREDVSDFFQSKLSQWFVDLVILDVVDGSYLSADLLRRQKVLPIKVMYDAFCVVNLMFASVKEHGKGVQISVILPTPDFITYVGSLHCCDLYSTIMANYACDIRAIGKLHDFHFNAILAGDIADNISLLNWFHPTLEAFSKKVKVGIEWDKPIIAVPSSQYGLLFIFSCLPLYIRQLLSKVLYNALVKMS
ncbi:hypothetical protein CLU79DRAFT_736599 [Phycomyces nitens]|nr:hypothetical protein CLU79DRAFT_736599 [Phycomyces nitens]